VKAGRPKRGVVERLGVAVKATVAMDLPQVLQGGRTE